MIKPEMIVLGIALILLVVIVGMPKAEFTSQQYSADLRNCIINPDIGERGVVIVATNFVKDYGNILTDTSGSYHYIGGSGTNCFVGKYGMTGLYVKDCSCISIHGAAAPVVETPAPVVSTPVVSQPAAEPMTAAASQVSEVLAQPASSFRIPIVSDFFDWLNSLLHG